MAVKSSGRMSSDRVDELLRKERQLHVIANAWGEVVVADLQVDSWYDNMTAYNKAVRLLKTLTEDNDG